jgi:hypothetical protein
MVWFFERHGQYLQYEVRRAPDSEAYELVVRYPDAPTRWERIVDPHLLVERFKETQGQLRRDGWTIAGTTDLLGLR